MGRKPKTVRAQRCRNPDCLKALTATQTAGRPRLYCSDACKQAAYRQRERKAWWRTPRHIAALRQSRKSAATKLVEDVTLGHWIGNEHIKGVPPAELMARVNEALAARGLPSLDLVTSE